MQYCCGRVCLPSRQWTSTSSCDVVLVMQSSFCTVRHPNTDMWPTNSPDLKVVDYCVWGMMQKCVYHISIHNMDELQQRIVRNGLNLSRAWWMMRLISGIKDWKHVSRLMVVTLNTCCDVACLTFKLPHNSTGSFLSCQCHTTQFAVFRATNIWRETIYLPSDEWVLHFTR